jgi:hypothetical protein
LAVLLVQLAVKEQHSQHLTIQILGLAKLLLRLGLVNLVMLVLQAILAGAEAQGAQERQGT